MTFFFGCATLAGGCSEPPASPSGTSVSERDSLGVRIVEIPDPYAAELPIWRVDPEPSVSIGVTQTDTEYELFQVTSAATTSDGAIVVANDGTSEIRIYDSRGGHVRSFGRPGEGPGEFAALSWLGVERGDTIVAFDERLRRITWFTLEGDVIRTLALDPAGAGGQPEAVGMVQGRFLVHSGFDRQFPRGERRDTVDVWRYDESGSLADTLGTYPATERFFYHSEERDFAARFEPIFGRTVSADASAARLVISSTDAFELDVFEGVSLSMKVRADVAEPAVSFEEIEAWRTMLSAQYSRTPASLSEAFAEAVEAIPSRPSVPALQRLLLDEGQFIWVQQHPRTPGEPRQWVVLSSAGRAVGRAEVEADWEVLWIGQRHVIVLRHDELGSESLTVHGLDRG